MPTGKIVLVDDQPLFVATCKRLLGQEYEVVRVAHSGRDALAAVADLAPDLLLLDIGLPDISGLEVLEALGQQAGGPRVVVLTLHQDPAIAERAFSLGAHGFVTKVRMARDLPAALRATSAGQRFCSPLPESA